MSGAAIPFTLHGDRRSAMLKFGISLFFTEYSMTPALLAQEVEGRGFESVWSGEQSHMPAELKTPFPGEGEVKRHYYDVMDPFVTLTAAAMATKTLKIGTGVCLIPQRDPMTPLIATLVNPGAMVTSSSASVRWSTC